MGMKAGFSCPWQFFAFPSLPVSSLQRQLLDSVHIQLQASAISIPISRNDTRKF